jgi:hypothetical protein
MFPVGFELASGLGLVDAGALAHGAVWLLAAAWLTLVLAIGRNEGTPLGQRLMQFHLALQGVLGVVFVGLGGIVLQREPRDGLLLAMGLFLVHALINIAHRPGWLSAEVAPHWFTVGCAIYDVYLAGLCYLVWRR